MKTRILIAMCVLSVALPALAAKPCDELKGEIDARIRANGVPAFSLDVIDAAAETSVDGKVVGSCDGGSKRIVYRRGEASAAPIADPEPTEAPVTPAQ